MSSIRPALWAALAMACGLLLAGCGDSGGLVSAGATQTAAGPVELWPRALPTISVPPIDYGERDTQRVAGVRTPDARAVSPAAVVRADVSAQPAGSARTDGLTPATVRQLSGCTPRPSTCPLLKPFYSDLTGDGKDELIVGISLPDKQTSIRVYMPENGGLTRILQDAEPIVGVSLTQHALIMRSVSAGIPGYEYRTVWTWDAHQQAMLATQSDIVRTKPGASSPEPPLENR
ncbi:hypothetical protein ACIHAA_27710 [Streptomyces sp. NPDC052040]|uniref:hypothetical protein n=1 Tax=unclassified Streptomyces TaxID=2593676 RepID=UPI0037CFB9AF